MAPDITKRLLLRSPLADHQTIFLSTINTLHRDYDYIIIVWHHISWMLAELEILTNSSEFL